MKTRREEALAALTGAGAMFELVTITDEHGSGLRTYATGPTSLRDVLLASRLHGDATFLVFEDERLSFAAHFQLVARLAHWLREQGVKKGDRVAVGMRNYPEWVVSFFACQALGAIAVTLNAWWTAQELLYGLTDSGAKVALLDGERYRRITPLLSELPDLRLLVTRHKQSNIEAPDWESELAKYGEAVELPEADVTANDHATILYTSGTTGVPKGALHTHRNHITNIQNTLLGGAVALAMREQVDAETEEAPRQPASLQTFPFFHIGGVSGLYLTAVTGGKLVLMYRWDVSQALELIQREKVLSWSGVPMIVRQLLEHPEATSGALDSLTNIASGGAPVPEDLINTVGTMFQQRVMPGNGYGATETTSAIIVNGGLDYLERPSSVGRPVITVDVRITDDDGNDVAEGDVGEIWLRGPNMFVGYWGRPVESRQAFEGSWYKTGDLGYRDSDGFYYIVDRKKDVIIRGGENVYCAEVEGVLHKHPDIADVALIGLTHRELGEEVVAVVEGKPGARISEADVQAFVAERLARFNVPTRVFFINEPLPRTATGKILKRDLKLRYQ